MNAGLFSAALTDDAQPELRAALTAIEEQLGRPGVVGLPPCDGLDRGVFVRWLFRLWCEARQSWPALVWISAAGCPVEFDLGDAFQQAARGWLFLNGEAEQRWSPEALAPQAERYECRVVLARDLAPLRFPRPLLERIRHLDAFHLPAVDPSIASLRRALASYCQAGAIVHLRGPAGSGKRCLARWAHARFGQTALATVRKGSEAPPPGRSWQLYEEMAQLEGKQLVQLRERLHESEDFQPGYRAELEDEGGRPPVEAFAEILGESPALCRVLRKAARYGATNLPLLILGKTGTGKELLARAVHEVSRRPGRFVAIDLTTRSETLLEGALFGHVKGAFTGAHQARKGALLEADRGTLFLDELGNLGLSTQAKLLRVLEYGEVTPLGSDRPLHVDVRIVAATNADLEGMVRLGEFREDFLFRFNPHATLRLPALKDRADDVLLLADQLLARLGGPPRHFGPASREMLRTWDWPGNVRELRHAVEAAAIECEGEEIRPEHLPSIAQARGWAPVLITSSQTAEERLASWPLSRSEIQKLTSVTLEVIPLAEREGRAVRSAVLRLLEGRPISGEALTALERRVWWGNFPELWTVVQTLCRNVDGPIDLATLHRHIPDLNRRENLAPIRTILFPSIRSGCVVGLERSFLDRAILVGRVERLSELDPGGEGPEREQQRWQALQQLFEGTPPGCLDLGFLGRLSRAHLAIKREDRGLVVHSVAGAALPVFAGPFPGDEPFCVAPDEPVFIGEAGEIRVLTAQGRPYLHLIVACGALPPVDERVAQRFPRKTAGKTVGTPQQRVTIWTLEPAEIDVLVPLVLEALQSESFAVAIRGWAQQHAPGVGSQLWKLARYLDSSHPTQSASRLFAHPSNDALRRGLATRLAAEQGARQLWLKLPVGIRRNVELPS